MSWLGSGLAHLVACILSPRMMRPFECFLCQQRSHWRRHDDSVHCPGASASRAAVCYRSSKAQRTQITACIHEHGRQHNSTNTNPTSRRTTTFVTANAAAQLSAFLTIPGAPANKQTARRTNPHDAPSLPAVAPLPAASPVPAPASLPPHLSDGPPAEDRAGLPTALKGVRVFFAAP